MMYGEFIEATGCKQTDYNFQVFCDLEKMYMADDSISKEKIYEYGKKLVDNSLTPEQIQHNKDTEERIAEYKDEIKSLKSEIEAKQFYIGFENDEFRKKHLKLDIQELKARIKEIKNQIEIAKSFIYT